jgi:hypothetical protein
MSNEKNNYYYTNNEFFHPKGIVKIIFFSAKIINGYTFYIQYFANKKNYVA